MNAYPASLLLLILSAISLHDAARLTTMLRTTTPFITTLPPGCVTDEGELVHPGQEKMIVEVGACRMCSCSGSGQLSCSYNDCLVPMCVDAHRAPGSCCATCPNGRNCRVPATGDVIPAGRRVTVGGMECECPPQNYMLPGMQSEADYTAVCRQGTTIPAWFLTTVPVGRR